MRASARRLLAVMLTIMLVLLGFASEAQAEPNAVRVIDLVRDAGQQVLRVQLQRPLATAPAGFATAEPPRIVLDLPATANATGRQRQVIGTGAVRHVDIVQAGARTRLVLSLQHTMGYSTRLRDAELLVVLNPPSSGASTGERAAEHAAEHAANTAVERNAVVDIDFRRGEAGAGRVVIDLSREPAAIDVRRQG